MVTIFSLAFLSVVLKGKHKQQTEKEFKHLTGFQEFHINH